MKALRYLLALAISDVGFWVDHSRDIAQVADYYRKHGRGRFMAWFEASVGWDPSREARNRFSYRFPLLLLALVAAVALWKYTA